jgi:hypothetical protein
MAKQIIKKIDAFFIEDDPDPTKAILLLPMARYCLNALIEEKAKDNL